MTPTDHNMRFHATPLVTFCADGMSIFLYTIYIFWIIDVMYQIYA
jgi:hypothetical protein